MKKQIKRFSKSTLAVILTLCMLMSCFTVGIVSTNAAQMESESTGAPVDSESDPAGASADSDSVGATTAYLLYSTSNQPGSFTNTGVTVSNSGSTFSATITPSSLSMETGRNYFFALSSKSSLSGLNPGSFGFYFSESYSSGNVTVTADSGFSGYGTETCNASYNDTSYVYKFARIMFSTVPSSFTVTVDSSSRSYEFETAAETKYNVTIAAGTGGSVVAGSTTISSENSKTVAVGNTAGITITANSATGYTFEKWEVTGTTSNVTLGSTTDRSTNLKASGTGATVTAKFKESATTTRRVFYDNSLTNWSQPYAFAWVEGGSVYTSSFPGTKMTKYKGNVWYIDVSTDAVSIIFDNGSSGVPANQTRNLTIPTDMDDPGPEFYQYNKSNSTGTWRPYSEEVSANHYKATLSSGIQDAVRNGKMYSNIKATFYDYYYDTEVNNGWITGITGNEYKGYIGNTGNILPYDTLNKAIKAYSSSKSVTYPMYFGNFNNYWDDLDSNNTVGYNFRRIVNNSGETLNSSSAIGLTRRDYGLTGLTGKTLADGTIHHYKASVANENGDEIPFFNEKWLSGENNEGRELASIIDSKFPVRIDTVRKITLQPGTAWNTAGAWFSAHVWVNSNTSDYRDIRLVKESNGNYVAYVPTRFDRIEFLRHDPAQFVEGYNNLWDRSGSLTINGSTYTITAHGSNGGNASGNWSGTAKNTNYYEYDSTGATDNAWFTGLKTNNTVLNYGAGASNGAKSLTVSGHSSYGFYPFDTNRNGAEAKNLGFGMKAEIEFTLGENGQINGVDQEFMFSGDDDLWIYIDNNLVLDLGGDHMASSGLINFHSNTVSVNNTDNVQSKLNAGSATRNSTFTIDSTKQVHTMTMYYLERGMFDSNLKFGFNFTPVGTEFEADKKVSYANVNRGILDVVESTAADDSFTVTHSASAGTTDANYNNIGTKSYTYNKQNGTNEIKNTSSGTYELKDQESAHFANSLTKTDYLDHYFQLVESASDSNKFEYSPKVTVTDNEITSGDNTISVMDVTNGGKFKFQNKAQDATATDMVKVNLTALLTNTLKTKDLVITKKLTGALDNTTEFTICVEIDLGDGSGYQKLPLRYIKDGTEADLESGVATFTLVRNQSAVFSGIPENAKVRVSETTTGLDPYEYVNTSVLDDDDQSVSTTAYKGANAKGATFTLDQNSNVTINNRKIPEFNLIVKKETDADPVDETTSFDFYINKIVSGTITPYTGDYTKTSANGETVTAGTIAAADNGKVQIKQNEQISLEGFREGDICLVYETDPVTDDVYEYSTTTVVDHLADSQTIDPTINETTYKGARFTFTDDSAFVTITNTKIVHSKEVTVTKLVTDYKEANPFTILVETSANGTTNWTALAKTEFTSDKRSGTLKTGTDGKTTIYQDEKLTFTIDVDKYVRITETLPTGYVAPTFTAVKRGSNPEEPPTDFSTSVANSCSFKVNTADVDVTITNSLQTYKYVITYNYEAYIAKTYKDYIQMDNDNREKGPTRSYTQRGDITQTELSTYFDINAQTKEITFKNTTARKTFINNHAPYEDDFMMAIEWSDKDPEEATYSNGTIKVVTEGESKPDRTVKAYFKLPYAVDGNLAATGTTKITAVIQDPISIQYGNHVTVNDDFVTAPRTLDGGYYFQYWQITFVTGSDANNDKVANNTKRCYYDKFNMTLYQNAYIEPIYDTTPTEFSPSEASYKDTEGGEATVSFIENSRSSWNEDGAPDQPTDIKKQGGDRIYSDFLLTFGYKDKQLNTYSGNVEGANVKLGFVVEKVAKLRTVSGKYVTESQKDYQEEYGATPSEDVTKFINGTLESPHGFLMNQNIAFSSLDNKNQMKYSLDMKNKEFGEREEPTDPYRNYVYRAYTYTKVGNNIVVSTPVYFTIYDMASIETV